MKHPIFATLLLTTCLTPGADAPKKELTSLSAEEQQIAQGMKIVSVELAPKDTRHFTYIKGEVKMRNSGPLRLVPGRMDVEMQMLFQNKDKKWDVIHSKAKLDVPDKGPQTVDISFSAQNKQIETLTGKKDAKPDDEYVVVTYSGVVLYEQPAKQPARAPKEWWKGLPAQ